MPNMRRPFRLNVGFIIHENVGYSSDFSFDIDSIVLGSDLHLGGLHGQLDVGRTTQGVLFTGGFTAHTTLECVRCIKPFEQELRWSLTEAYALRANGVSESELMVPEDAQIDLEPIIREYALLEVPINPICRPDCRGLCPVCGQDLNVLDCGHRAASDGSAFAALRDFLPK
jgi:uncharacterized protein